MARKYVCRNCGTVGNSKIVTKGSFFIELILWLSFLIPGLIYTAWRMTSKYKVCRNCKSADITPADSLVGKKLIKELQEI